jgi:tetratricopeptide (TPR) repeat protein
MIEGTLSQLGENWILTAQLIDITTGTVVGSQRIDGSDLYTMVDELTDRLRNEDRFAIAGIGSGVSVRDKTTSSLETYRRYLSGVELLNSGLYGAAAETLAAAISLDPTFGQAYYKQAMALWWQGHDIEAAKGALSRILTDRLYASRLERLMAEAGLELISQEWDNAEALYRQVSEQYPDEKEGWYGFGEALFHSDTADDDETVAAFEHAIELDPSFTLAYRHVFDIATRRGEFTQALQRIRAFIAQHPDNPIGYRWWVSIAAQLGDEEAVARAMVEAGRAGSTPEDRRHLLVEAGNGCRMREDFIKAKEFYLQAKELDPEGRDLVLYSGLGNVYFGLHEGESGQELLNEFAEHFPEMKKELELANVEILVANGKLQEAIETARSCCSEDPDDISRFIALGKAYVRAGEYADADKLRDSLLATPIEQKKRDAFLRSVGQELFSMREFDRSR